MITEDEKQKIVAKVHMEIAKICQFYRIDFYSLDSNMRSAIIEIFQAGVGWQDLIKKELIDKSIKDLTKKS